MKDFSKSEAAQYRGIRIDIRPATAARLADIDPLVTSLGIKPEGEATAIAQSGNPVTGAVGGFWFLVLHKTRIPGQPHP